MVRASRDPELAIRSGASGVPSVEDRRVWAEVARGAVRRAGHNRGAARDMLIEVFASHDCALSVPEVEERLTSLDPSRPVARASIYRGLELLQTLDLLVRLDVGDGVARYERSYTGGNDHHHHMVCDRCGLLMPFDDDQLEAAIEDVSARLGFDAKGHEVTLHGTCLECH